MEGRPCKEIRTKVPVVAGVTRGDMGEPQKPPAHPQKLFGKMPIETNADSVPRPETSW